MLERKFLGFTLGFILTALLLYVVYSQAQGMTWGFDDYINLKGLRDVDSREGLRSFLFNGIAGPGGRVLSLATFLANYADWPNNPWGFALTTLILHAINGLLIFLFLQRLLVNDPLLKEHVFFLALIASFTWLLMPIHASSILLPIQRMTHVSTFFVLVGLYGYTLLRGPIGTPKIEKQILLSVWVAVFAVLAALAKENGIVLITLVAIIELFFYFPLLKFKKKGDVTENIWKLWIFCAIAAVPMLLIGYVAWSWQNIDAIYKYHREFTLWERLATQMVVLWEYMQQTVVPRSAKMGPYHDGYTVYTWRTPATYLALVAWLGLCIGLCAVMLKANKKLPKLLAKYALFSLLWFFAVHQVESSIIPLEQYFEHRNYLAVLGISLFIAVLLYSGLRSENLKKVSQIAFVILIGYHVFVLQQVTSLWGRPLLANQVWYMNNPSSTRAAQSIMDYFIKDNNNDDAWGVVEKFSKENNSIDMLVQIIPSLCKAQDVGLEKDAFESILQILPSVKHVAGVTTGIAAMGNAIRSGECQEISLAEYRSLLLSFLEIDKIKFSPRVRHHINYEMALTEEKLGNIDGYAYYGKKSFFDFPGMSMAEVIAVNLFEGGRGQLAIDWIDEVVGNNPGGLMNDYWRTRFASLKNAILEVKEHFGEGNDKK